MKGNLPNGLKEQVFTGGVSRISVFIASLAVIKALSDSDSLLKVVSYTPEIKLSIEVKYKMAR